MCERLTAQPFIDGRPEHATSVGSMHRSFDRIDRCVAVAECTTSTAPLRTRANGCDHPTHQYYTHTCACSDHTCSDPRCRRSLNTRFECSAAAFEGHCGSEHR